MKKMIVFAGLMLVSVIATSCEKEETTCECIISGERRFSYASEWKPFKTTLSATESFKCTTHSSYLGSTNEENQYIEHRNQKIDFKCY